MHDARTAGAGLARRHSQLISGGRQCHPRQESHAVAGDLLPDVRLHIQRDATAVGFLDAAARADRHERKFEIVEKRAIVLPERQRGTINLGDNEYRISMAVAGFHKDEFKIDRFGFRAKAARGNRLTLQTGARQDHACAAP